MMNYNNIYIWIFRQTEINDYLFHEIFYAFLQNSSSVKKNDSISIPVESKYKNQYEQRIDPFTSFSNQERQRKWV